MSQDSSGNPVEASQAQMEAQITERLQQEVDRRFSQDQRQHAIAEVVASINDDDTRYIKNLKFAKFEELLGAWFSASTCW